MNVNFLTLVYIVFITSFATLSIYVKILHNNNNVHLNIETNIKEEETINVQPIQPFHKNAVFTLIRGGYSVENYKDFANRCRCMRSYTKEEYDDNIFHEGNIPLKIQKEFINEFPNIRFFNVHDFNAFQLPEKYIPPRIRRYNLYYSNGYKHMCRFFAIQWIHIFKKYEYVMRVDEDVCLHSNYDAFKEMSDGDLVYAFALETTEKHEETLETFEPWLNDYVFKYNINEKNRAINTKRMYFTNVFVTKVSWWFQKEVLHFLSHVDSSMNIYTHRWGDAPIQSAALDMFADKNTVKNIKIDYTHLSTENEIRNGKEVP